MAKNKNQSEEPVTESTPSAPAGNFTLTYARTHPGNRCSYRIPGNTGLVVIHRNLFADPNNMPETITVNVPLAEPKVVAPKLNAEAKIAAKVAREAERAAKTEARIAEQTKRANERAAKAQERAAALLAKLQDKAAKVAASAPPVDPSAS